MKSITRITWRKKSLWTLEAAKALLDAVRPICTSASLNCVKNYIAIEVNGNNYMWLHKRSDPKSLTGIRFDEAYLEEAKSLLDDANISYVQKDERLRLTVDARMIQVNASVFGKIAEHVRNLWEE